MNPIIETQFDEKNDKREKSAEKDLYQDKNININELRSTQSNTGINAHIEDEDQKEDVKEDEKFAQVVVADDQLSLAIGKAGQNARLAARLTNWKIDIKSESQMREILLARAEENSETENDGDEVIDE